MSYEGMRVWANSQGRMKRDGEVAPWRPWEPCRENVAEARESCNRHSDCAAADRRAKAAGKYADHCYDSGCEECFG